MLLILAIGPVSVIDGFNNTKIKDIEIGGYPSAIAVNEILYITSNTIYVSAENDTTVFVIDIYNNTKAFEMEVGYATSAISDSSSIKVVTGGFSAIDVNMNNNTIYVADSINNTVSVIDRYNNTRIKDIGVGDNPSAYRC